MKTQMNAFRILLVVAATFPAIQTAAAADAIDAAKGRVDGNVAYYDIRLIGVEGQGWSDTAAPFDRFPAKAEKSVRGSVWGLSRHSAGLCVRFVTDATEIHAKWTLT